MMKNSDDGPSIDGGDIAVGVIVAAFGGAVLATPFYGFAPVLAVSGAYLTIAYVIGQLEQGDGDPAKRKKKRR
jgi:hypothetical protein